MEQIILDAISNIGIPTAIAFYVLIRVNQNLEELTAALHELRLQLKENRQL